MQPLIDGDILLHEIGWSGEFKDKETGESILFEFERVQDILNEKIRLICEDVEATSPPIIFITDNEWLAKKEGREFVQGKRYEIAKTKPYKGTRKNPKPFHFYNLIVYMMSEYEVVVAKNGLEADDVICRYQNEDTIICSRDKDLRICPGWHFSWECGKQKSIGPYQTDDLGFLRNEGGKIWGAGLAFFYFQMLSGDAADNIPGVGGIGPVKAYNLLKDCRSEEELYIVVKQTYKDNNKNREYFLEQGNLLWMRFRKNKRLE